DEILCASSAANPALQGISLQRLQQEGAIPFTITPEERIPFSGGIFPTPSGKVEFYSQQAAAKGYDPVPNWEPEAESNLLRHPRKSQQANCESATSEALPLLCPGAHHFISSSFANQQTLMEKEHAPTLRIHPDDAEVRSIRS